MADDGTRFAAYPSAVVYSKPNTTATKNAVQHLLWGDWLSLREGKVGKWQKVRARGVTGWMHEDDIQENRLLEINFVDIGQGDGCLVVTPEDRFIVIDAGEKDNMFRFLRWRFGKFREDVHFESLVITHPDADHYKGFQKLLSHKHVHVGTIYHNGIVERKADDALGSESTIRGVDYLDDVVRNLARLKKILKGEKLKKSRKLYSKLLRTALDGGRVGDIRMLSSLDKHMPRYKANKALSIEVLGPVPEKVNGKYRLRSFGKIGLTKNGHSVVLRLRYNRVNILLGGDLNIPAENHLLKAHTGIDPETATGDKKRQLLAKARKKFECDIAKACHHGSADFRELFLEAVNATVTVVSSGDEESHSHPRPDALGSFGRYGRGTRPLIFSTELARSSREQIKAPNQLRARLSELSSEAANGSTKSIRESARQKFRELVKTLDRSVAVYGMITLRTDGNHVVIAQKLEKPRSKKSKWDIHRLEPGPGGRLTYLSKH